MTRLEASIYMLGSGFIKIEHSIGQDLVIKRFFIPPEILGLEALRLVVT